MIVLKTIYSFIIFNHCKYISPIIFDHNQLFNSIKII